MRRKPLVLTSLATALCGAGAASAADGNPLTERFSLTLGAYAMQSDTKLRVDDVDGFRIGTTFDLEDYFHFDRETVFRLEGAWRIAGRHHLRAMYFDSDRTRTVTNGTVLNFGDETFPVNVALTSDFDFRIMEVAYEYAFWKREHFELGASVGVHNVSFTTRLRATVSAPVGSGSATLQEEASADAPLPVIGLRGIYRFGESNLYANAHLQYFSLDASGFDGRLFDAQAGVLWQFSRRVGVGAAYNLFDTDVTADEDAFAGRLDWNYSGAQIYLRASF